MYIRIPGKPGITPAATNITSSNPQKICRFPGVKSEEAELLLITDWLMMNGEAGIIDLNLHQKQLVIGPYSSTNMMSDYFNVIYY